MIKPYIKHGAVIVDVGSDVGFFSIRMAEEFPDSLVVSVEQAEHACQIQAELLKLKKLTNVILCWHKMDLPTLKGLAASVHAVDQFLILSVFQHYPIEVVREHLSYYSQISPELITEVPEVTGDPNKVTGGKQYSHFDQELKGYYDHVEVIGESILSPHEKRVIYKAWNDHLLRAKLASTFVFLETKMQERFMNRRHKLEYKSDSWIFNDGKRPFITGISAWTLLHWRPIYPETDWWQREAVEAYERLIREGMVVWDIRPFNLLVTPKGMVAIDYAGSIANFKVEQARAELEKLTEVFANLDLFIPTTFRLFTEKANPQMTVEVVSDAETPRLGAVVQVLLDDKVITQDVTDEYGTVSFNLPVGRYHIKVIA